MLISIIVTVCNKEKYIGKCIESVINQTYKELEIIIINDGSTDQSESVIDNYIHDKRIKSINQENKGVSYSRNRGIQIAKSKYIFFLDGDDELTENTISELAQNTNDGPDIIVGNFIYKSDIYNRKNTAIREGNYYSSSQLDKIQFKYDMFVSNGRPLASACNKLYKKEFLIKNELFFEDNLVSEDRLFNLCCICYKPRIVLINKYTYIVNITDNSRSRSFDKNFYKSSITLFENFYNFLKKNAFLTKNDDLLFLTLLNDIEKIHYYIYKYSLKKFSDTMYYTKMIKNDCKINLILENGLKNKYLNKIKNNGKKWYLVIYVNLIMFIPQLVFHFFYIYRLGIKCKANLNREEK